MVYVRNYYLEGMLHQGFIKMRGAALGSFWGDPLTRLDKASDQ